MKRKPQVKLFDVYKVRGDGRNDQWVAIGRGPFDPRTPPAGNVIHHAGGFPASNKTEAVAIARGIGGRLVQAPGRGKAFDPAEARRRVRTEKPRLAMRRGLCARRGPWGRPILRNSVSRKTRPDEGRALSE
jgi:hypothetical protein